MEANEILLHSELLYFYIKKGFYISKLYRFFEYQGSPALSKVYKDVYEARVAATNTSDETKSTAIKDRYLLKNKFNIIKSTLKNNVKSLYQIRCMVKH